MGASLVVEKGLALQSCFPLIFSHRTGISHSSDLCSRWLVTGFSEGSQSSSDIPACPSEPPGLGNTASSCPPHTEQGQRATNSHENPNQHESRAAATSALIWLPALPPPTHQQTSLWN